MTQIVYSVSTLSGTEQMDADARRLNGYAGRAKAGGTVLYFFKSRAAAKSARAVLGMAHQVGAYIGGWARKEEGGSVAYFPNGYYDM